MKAKFRTWGVLTILLFMSLFTKGQSTELFFGANYWEYQIWSSGQLVNRFHENLDEIGSWNPGIVRIGGNAANVHTYAQFKEWFEPAIQDALAIGAIPLVQLPIHLSATEVAEWMDYFNVTKGYGIRYWAIGNEPDPSGHGGAWDQELFTRWFQGTYSHDDLTYTQWRGQFRTLARAIKQKDANSIVVGPDFRHWWGSDVTGGSANNAMDAWYKDFLYGAGEWAVGTDDYNGDPLVDIFAFHWYGNSGEDVMISRYALMMAMIQQTNTIRASNGQAPIKIAVGEYNTNDAGTFWSGQHMAIMAKQSLKNGAVFMAPWSPLEGNNFRMMEANGTLRSTGHHWKMLSQNHSGNYMEGQINNNQNYNIMEFGMQDANGYTIMLMNKSATNYTFSVNFSTTPGSYAAAGTIKFRFNANETVNIGGTLYANSTRMYRLDANGNVWKEIEYRSGWAQPSENIINVPLSANFEFPVNGATYAAGATVPVRVNVNLAPDAGNSVYNVKLYLDGQLLPREENIGPYDWGLNGNDPALVNMASGNHTLRAVVTNKTNAAQTTETSLITFTVGNPLHVVSFAYPLQNAAYDPGTAVPVRVNITPTPAVGNEYNVKLYLDGQLLPREENAATYDWGAGDPLLTNMAPGAHVLRSVATNIASGVANEATVTITINTPVVPPAVSFGNITAGQVFAYGFDLTPAVNAAHASGIAGVQLYVDNVFVRTEAQAPYDWGWATPADDLLATLSPGAHSLRAVAFANGGETAEVTVNITITAPIVPPTVSFGNITDGQAYDQGFDLTPSVNAAHASGIAGVQLYVDNVFVRTEAQAPYDWGWATPADDVLAALTPGAHSFRAVAVANGGPTAEVTVNITIVADPLTLSYFVLENGFSGDYIRPTNGSGTALITQYELAALPTMDSYQWQIILNATSGYYHIVNKWTGNAIFPTGESEAQNATLSQVALTAANAANPALQWSITPATGAAGFYWIQNVKSGLAIRPQGPTNGGQGTVAIVQNTLNATYSSFRWELIPMSGVNARVSDGKLATENEELTSKSLSVFPNPATERINLSFETDWELINISGIRILTGSGNEINVSGVTSGIYFVRTRLATRTIIIK